MNYDHRNIERLARSIANEIEEALEKAGIFNRIFFRCKKRGSLEKKLATQSHLGVYKYDGASKFLRDVIGIRINLYFMDDLELITEFVKKRYHYAFVEETIDFNETTEFKPTRTNIIFRIPNKDRTEFQELVRDSRIDPTFELQLRTVFSEGWHEVEHDLRYKCQDDWEPYPDMSRMFNGFLAALETQEWSMLRLFDQMAYLHYKSGNVDALIRTKLRIRIDDLSLTPDLSKTLDQDPNFRREVFKLDREVIVRTLLYHKPLLPLTINNIIFLINHCFIKRPSVKALQGELITRILQEIDNQIV